MRETEISEAIDGCFDAVIEEREWPRALQRLSEAAGAAAATFYPRNAGAAMLDMPASPEYRELLAAFVKGEWYKSGHYRAERGWPLLRTRRVITEHDLATDEERRKLAHFNELYLPMGLPGFMAVGFTLEQGPWTLVLSRSTGQGFFSQQEAQRLSVLGVHFRRMMMLAERMALASAKGGLEALDHASRASILIDGRGKAIAINQHAERLLGEALNLDHGYLRAAHPDSDRRLHALIEASRDREQPFAALPPVRIERPGKRPLLVEAIQPRGLLASIFTRAHAILMITDLAVLTRPHELQVQTALGLTKAETKLALRLCNGESLQEAAEDLGVSYETARTQLKSIFAKTDIRRQSELTQLLAKFPPTDTA